MLERYQWMDGIALLISLAALAVVMYALHLWSS